MLKIRYAELPGGIRARVDRGHGRGRVTIYLAPDMTPPQRRAMLSRLVRNSRYPGYGPRLPRIGVALAFGWDVTRAFVRANPAQSLVTAGSVAAGVTCLMLFVSVTVHLGPARPPLTTAQGLPPVIRVHARRLPRPRADVPPPAPGAVVPVAARTPAASVKASAAVPQPLATSPVPMSPSPSADSAPSSAPAVTPSPSPSPADGDGGTGACLQLGPLGVCVGV